MPDDELLHFGEFCNCASFKCSDVSAFLGDGCKVVGECCLMIELVASLDDRHNTLGIDGVTAIGIAL